MLSAAARCTFLLGTLGASLLVRFLRLSAVLFALGPRSPVAPPSDGRIVPAVPSPLGERVPRPPMPVRVMMADAFLSLRCLVIFLVSRWFLSRRSRNKLMHALHGNGPEPQGWSSVGRHGVRSSVSRRLDTRELQEPQPASRLRSAGWSLPEGISGDTPVRVYDTRFPSDWLRQLMAELGPGDPLYCVGGDFISKPFLEDGAALRPGRLSRWIPADSGPYQILVPPRPHLSQWVERCRQQLAVETPGTLFTVCCIVPRDACHGPLDAGHLHRLLPQARSLLEDPNLAVEAVAIGERPPVVRVPSGEMRLPPPQWEHGLLARNRVLLLLRFRQTKERRSAPSGRWMRGQPPPPEASPLELLRLEYPLPPATKQDTALRMVKSALTKLASVMQLQPPIFQQLRQVQLTHGSVLAIFGVPRDEAVQWLRGSGCGGLYLRPFWTENTGRTVARENFSLLWARGRVAEGPRLWEALKDERGVVGLLASGQDVAVRVTSEANLEALQVQLRFVAQDGGATFRRATPGLRWWRLGPLTEAELWRVRDLILATGLSPSGDLRFGRMGPFRHSVFFAASGDPHKRSLDDGSWSASEAMLKEADPPPRRTSTNVSQGGSALTTQSTWAGPRRSSPVSPADSSVVIVKSPPTAPVAATSQPSRTAAPPPPSSPPRRRRRERSSSRQRHPPPVVMDVPRAPPRVSSGSLEARLDQLMDRLDRLQQQNASLLEEIAQLRHENATLRRQLGRPSSSSSIIDFPPISLSQPEADSDTLMVDPPERPSSCPPAARQNLSMGPHGAHDL